MFVEGTGTRKEMGESSTAWWRVGWSVCAAPVDTESQDKAKQLTKESIEVNKNDA